MCCPGNKVKKIVTGYAYLMFGVNEELSKQRMRICRNCPKFEGGACKICGCEMAAKTRLPAETCPMNPPKWLPKI
jgi:hypothetical protein